MLHSHGRGRGFDSLSVHQKSNTFCVAFLILGSRTREGLSVKKQSCELFLAKSGETGTDILVGRRAISMQGLPPHTPTPFASTTSPQAAYRLRRLFLQKPPARSFRCVSFSEKGHAVPLLLACKRARNAPACYQPFSGMRKFKSHC